MANRDPFIAVKKSHGNPIQKKCRTLAIILIKYIFEKKTSHRVMEELYFQSRP